MNKIITLLFIPLILLGETSPYTILKELDLYINNNPWVIKYNNYSEYNNINVKILQLQKQLEALKTKGMESSKEALIIEKKIAVLQKQEKLLINYKNDPYKELINPYELEEIPNITNPFLIPSGLSYIKNLKAQIANINDNYNSLNLLLQELNRKLVILESLKGLANEIASTKAMIDELDSMQKVLSMYMEIFKNDAENSIAKVQIEIKNELIKLGYILVTVVILFLLSFLLKFLIRAYVVHDDVEKSYTINKLINILNISIIVVILVFAYIENVTYIVAIIGFVSAGLAIAMKDWFMSFFGWMIIIGGGSIKPGDRIRIVKDNTTFVGDVIDISMLKITLYEDVTLVTYSQNRRAGRIIFIPNNFIFTTMIANYSHSNMKTVWDGIDITITFKSNYQKALKISSDIAKKYSLGHTETARRQLNKLKSKYSLHDINVEPRVFSFIVPNGIKISVWFQTNSYATLMMNSIISGAIIDAFNNENDIEISYPTTTVISKTNSIGDGNIESIL